MRSRPYLRILFEIKIYAIDGPDCQHGANICQKVRPIVNWMRQMQKRREKCKNEGNGGKEKSKGGPRRRFFSSLCSTWISFSSFPPFSPNFPHFSLPFTSSSSLFFFFSHFLRSVSNFKADARGRSNEAPSWLLGQQETSQRENVHENDPKAEIKDILAELDPPNVKSESFSTEPSSNLNRPAANVEPPAGSSSWLFSESHPN